MRAEACSCCEGWWVSGEQLQDVPRDSMVAWVLLLEGLHSLVHVCQLRYLCGLSPACIALLPKHLGFRDVASSCPACFEKSAAVVSVCAGRSASASTRGWAKQHRSTTPKQLTSNLLDSVWPHRL